MMGEQDGISKELMEINHYPPSTPYRYSPGDIKPDQPGPADRVNSFEGGPVVEKEGGEKEMPHKRIEDFPLIDGEDLRNSAHNRLDG